MTTPQDPRRHPLQDDEVELARVLRALPTGEPSSKVDAAILAAAADAVAAESSPARPRRRVRAAWALPTWAIGTAAAAVLAIGIGTQLLPPLAPSDDAEVSAEQALPQARMAEDRLDVDLVEPRREYPPTYPPPPPPPPAAAKPAPPPAEAKLEQPIVESAPAPAAFPEPSAAPAPAEDAGAFAPPPQDADAQRLQAREEQAESRLRQSPAELNRLDAERRAQARQLEQLRAARADAARDEAATGNRAATTAAAPAPAAAPPAAAASAESAMAEAEVGDDRAAAEAVAESESDATLSDRDAAADAAAPPAGYLGGAVQAQQALPPVSSDTALAPADWVARIRDRLRGGDRVGAVASLKLLRERHPAFDIPADLEALD